MSRLATAGSFLTRSSRDGRLRSRRVVWQAASVALDYPDRERVSEEETLRRALLEAAPEAAPSFLPLLDSWRSEPLPTLQEEYVDLFDLSGRRTLYLSYWTDGDTRRRGQALADFKQLYRRSGWLVNLHGELPDFLPLVLEYAAIADPSEGVDLLQRYGRSLELLRSALATRSSRHGQVVAAVCATLPGPTSQDRDAVQAMARSGPPAESVGLAPLDARLLPLVNGR